MTALLWAFSPLLLEYTYIGRMYGLGLLFECLMILGWVISSGYQKTGWIFFVFGDAGDEEFRVLVLNMIKKSDQYAHEIEYAVNDGMNIDRTVVNGQFLIHFLLDDRKREALVDFTIPENLASNSRVLVGDLRTGLFVSWAAWIPLERNTFVYPGVEGVVFNMGAIGDEMFIRKGFHGRKGVPGSDIR